MKINIIGPYFDSSGYSSHVRQLAYALNKFCEVSLTCNRPPNWPRLMEDTEFKMLSRNPAEADINICIGLPMFWKQSMVDGKPFIGFCVWEGDKVPVSWIDIFLDNQVKQIWVPSTHTKDAINNTFKNYLNNSIKIQGWEIKSAEIMNKIKIVNHGVNSKIFFPDKKNKDNIFRFIASKGWPNGSKDRGGLSFLLKAYMEEFNTNEKVEMLIKINSTYGMNNQILERNMRELNLTNKTPPAVKIIGDSVDYEKMCEIYNLGDIFCSTSLAEGFNLNILEAMACGLPAMTTMFGGMSDFCNDKNSWLLNDGKMIDVSWDLMYENVSWKLPSIKEIRTQLRYIFNHKEEIGKKSIEAIDTAKNYSWDNSGKIAFEFLQQIEYQ